MSCMSTQDLQLTKTSWGVGQGESGTPTGSSGLGVISVGAVAKTGVEVAGGFTSSLTRCCRPVSHVPGRVPSSRGYGINES
jgi:hypothetical protein